MPPSRTQDTRPQPKASTSKPRPPQRKAAHKDEGTNVPGVQKIKAALRQTRRLLAKDKLAADVRVETERRLKSLEQELAQAELIRKERAFALKYHKVKFFEKKKVLRKIKQTSSKLAELGEKSGRKNLEAELLEHRIDLNYILHYPKLERYISLFPPEAKKDEKGEEEPTPETDKTTQERTKLREQIRAQMKDGKLPFAPENELSSHSRTPTARPKGKATATAQPAVDDLEGDAFFGEDSDQESS